MCVQTIRAGAGELPPVGEESADLSICRSLAGPSLLKGQKQRVGVKPHARGLQSLRLLRAEVLGLLTDVEVQIGRGDRTWAPPSAEERCRRPCIRTPGSTPART